MPSKKKRYEVGRFFLIPPNGKKYTSYRIGRFDQSTKQTVSISTHTDDFEKAKGALHEYALKEGVTGEKLKDEPVLTSMNRFYLAVASKRPSEANFAATLMDVERILGSPLVSEMKTPNQLKLIARYREEGYADSTIALRLSCIWASMRHAVELEHLPPVAVPAQIKSAKWNAQDSAPKRLLTCEEVGKLLDVACSSSTGKAVHIDYQRVEWRYMVILLGSGARTGAATDLCLQQLDPVSSEHTVLHLNPAGRTQTHKHRPTIPVADIFGHWLKSWGPVSEEGHYVRYGKGLSRQTGERIFAQLNRRANLGFKVTPHMIRHFVATWLARSRHIASSWERDMFMGWKRAEGSAMGTIYNHYDPRFLRGAALAIQDLFVELTRHTFADILHTGFDDQPLPEDAWAQVPNLNIRTPPDCIALIPRHADATLAPRAQM